MITAKELESIYNFLSAINIPLSEVTKFVENYQDKGFKKQGRAEKSLDRYAAKIANEAVRNKDNTFSDVFDTIGAIDFDIPKTIIEAYNATEV